MKLLLATFLFVGNVFAGDATQDLIKQLTSEDQQESKSDYCRGNPPGQDDAWCSYVCVEGEWKKICR